MTLSPEVARERLLDARVYLLMTRSLCRLDPLVVLDEALTAGADVVQVREPGCGDRELLEWVHDVRERCARHRVPVIVNDRIDVAILAGADGVHVGQGDLPPRAVRELAGEAPILGLSTHDLEQVKESATEPVDYIGVGPVFDTPTKDTPGLGADWLRDVLPHAVVPAFGIGGMGTATVTDAIDAGLRRIATSSAVCGAEEPGAVIHALRESLEVGGR
jgi:thiamine-phosphate pyrophosphorylase